MMEKDYFRNKRILIISPENWAHLFVSKHHYAIELAKNNQVYFLNPPSDRWSHEKTDYKNVQVINYTPFLKGLRFLPPFLQRFLMRRKYQQLQRLTAVTFDCVWSFDNSVFFDFSFLPDRVLTISHIVDHSQDFQLGKAAATAQVCLGVSQNIVKKLSRYNRHTYLVPHGLAGSNREAQPQNLPGKNLIKAVYAGNLDSNLIDFDVLFKLVDKFPQVDFVFFGTGGNGWPGRANVYRAGRVSTEKLGDYLRSADVLLMVYDSEKFPEQLTNAHKVLEYLHAGKVIVSSFVSDYAALPELLNMAKTNKDLPELFEQVIADLPFYNDPQKIMQRRQYAERNSYAHRLSEIENIIQNLPQRF